MKFLKWGISTLAVLGLVFVSSIGIAADKAAKEDADLGVGSKVKIPAGEEIYKQGFEEEDDLDSWMSDVSELEWKKGGCEDSKGCLKVNTPVYEKAGANGPEGGGGGYLEAEKYINFEDKGTIIDFDYFLNGIGTDVYVRGISSGGYNVSVKSPVKGKWAHARVKCAEMKNPKDGELATGQTFRTHCYVFAGVDKAVQDPYVLIDNVVITATGK